MDDKIKAKLQKLLTLAGNNPSPEEAAAAFARAQEIATKHRIELASIEIGAEPDPLVQELIQVGGKRIMGWKKVLSAGIAEANGVYAINLSGRGAFALAGRSSDVQTVAYLYAAISLEIERLSKTQHGRGRAYVNAFKMGAACVVVDRMGALARETVERARLCGASTSALVRVEGARDAGREHYRTNMPKGQRIVKSNTSTSCADGRRAGRRAGQSINIGGNAGLGRGARAAIGS